MMRTPTLTRWIAGLGTACLLTLGSVAAHADAGSLRSRYTELKPQLQGNSYGRQMFIDSTEGSNQLQGDVYAVLDHPFEQVRDALRDPNAWCDIMLLPFNTKYCRASDNQLGVRIGRKYNQPVEQAYRIDLRFQNVAATGDYFESRLTAPQGPVGTRDYRIRVESVPLDGGRTFMHLSYAYGYGTAGKIAMGAYLNTAGASKVGFSQSKDANGQQALTTGVRGAIERNAMRYYLAIDAYLAAYSLPPAEQVERRIREWYASTERYAPQLREMEKAEYLEMKRKEIRRQKQG